MYLKSRAATPPEVQVAMTPGRISHTPELAPEPAPAAPAPAEPAASAAGAWALIPAALLLLLVSGVLSYITLALIMRGLPKPVAGGGGFTVAGHAVTPQVLA